ncbi:MAG: hypothetical protein ACYDH5_17870, partial [Acidimicrobiales bacterium]
HGRSASSSLAWSSLSTWSGLALEGWRATAGVSGHADRKGGAHGKSRHPVPDRLQALKRTNPALYAAVAEAIEASN